MVRTRSQLEHLSKDELIDELMSIEDISFKLANLTTRFDNFSRRFKILSSELAFQKTAIVFLVNKSSSWKEMQSTVHNIIDANR